MINTLRNISSFIISASLMLCLSSALRADTDIKGQFLGAKTAVHPAWFKSSFLDFAEDIDDAAAEGKRLVLYFWQEGCPYCNQLWQHNMAVASIENNLKDNFDVVAINMWGDEEVVSVGGKDFSEKQLAQALNVDFTPTLIFYTEKKKPALRLNGYYPPQEFELALNYVKGRHESEGTFAKYKQQLNNDVESVSQVLDNTQPYFIDPSKLSTLFSEPMDKPLAVLFEKPNCEACNVLHSKTLMDQDTAALFKNMNVVQLNAASQQQVHTPTMEVLTAQQWATRLGLSYFPSIVYFDKEGEYIMQMDSAMRTFHTQSIMAYVLEEAYLSEPSFQRYISARAENIREQGKDVDIWKY